MKLTALIKIADTLDAAGFSKEADFVDLLILKTAVKHSHAVYSFAEDLIATLKSVASQPNVLTHINAGSLPEILQVIDTVLNQGQYGAQELGPDTLKELESQVYRLGAGILALEADLPKIQEAINNETDNSEKRRLKMEETKIKDNLQRLFDEVKKIKEGKREEDKQTYEQLKAYLKSRGKEI
jgi:hypothetical protein